MKLARPDGRTYEGEVRDGKPHGRVARAAARGLLPRTFAGVHVRDSGRPWPRGSNVRRATEPACG